MRGKSEKNLTAKANPLVPSFDRLEMEADLRYVRVERLESLAELAGNSQPMNADYIKELSTKNLYVALDIINASLVARQKKKDDPDHLPNQELLTEIANIDKRIDLTQSILVGDLIGRDEKYSRSRPF